jgi:ATP-binding cassette subfamily F protein uup
MAPCRAGLGQRCRSAKPHAAPQIETHNAWNLETRISTTISRLALPADKPFADLSGGLKRRVLLGQALVAEPDLLLLDEPTNHLDIESILWLEDLLASSISIAGS